MPLGLSGSGLITGFDPTASGFGKVLQVVRATDTTNRSTTSTSFVDAGISVTITPQKSNSKIIIMNFLNTNVYGTNTNLYGYLQITDSANNSLSGVSDFGILISFTGTAYVFGPTVLSTQVDATTTNARTYKLQYRNYNASNTVQISNNPQTGQMYAIEVAA